MADTMSEHDEARRRKAIEADCARFQRPDLVEHFVTASMGALARLQALKEAGGAAPATAPAASPAPQAAPADPHRAAASWDAVIATMSGKPSTQASGNGWDEAYAAAVGAEGLAPYLPKPKS